MYLPDGNIRFLGRNDNQVKFRGFRIELDEIGNILGSHPDVTDATVGLKRAGAGDRIVAMVCAANTGVDAKTLQAFLRDHLPPYMIPEEILFVGTMPLTPTGKIDRQALFAGDGM
jgi:acyl-coenzyme A synthetase/AMP-(fatty) acid ligase